MEKETLAEVICNLNGSDPNDDADWDIAMADAESQMLAVSKGEMEAWWEDTKTGLDAVDDYIDTELDNGSMYR